MVSQIRAIETEWRGCLFRSRLEARWAVYFEALCIDWEYEPEGFVLDDGRQYLPDFLLHGIEGRGGPDLYVEVKGHMSEHDMEKVRGFAEHRPIYIVGSIPYDGQHDGKHWFALMEEACYKWPYPYNFETVDGDHFGAFLGVDAFGRPRLFGDDGTYLADAHEWANSAALCAAKQARFEHRERPEDAMGFTAAIEAVRTARVERRPFDKSSMFNQATEFKED